MFSSPPQASSPLAHQGTKSNRPAQMFPPSQPPPLAGSSPTTAMQARRKREYKSQNSSRSAASSSLSGGIEDTPQKQFLRDRFKARCLERMKDNRAREIRKRRASSSIDGSSSDGFDIDDDSAMDEDENEDYTLDDELYRRVMMNEERRIRHSKRVSFERDFGSSIDPNMYEDMETLEWELTGKASKYNAPSPPSELYDDSMIQEYLAELEDIQREQEQQKAAHIETGAIDLNTEDPVDLEHEFTRENDPPYPSPSRSMYSDLQMSSPPSSPSRPGLTPASPLTYPPELASTWNCPFCSIDTPRTQVACTTCMTQYPLQHATDAWLDQESHPDGHQRDHVPLVTMTPSIGVLMLCGAPKCDWCFAL